MAHSLGNADSGAANILRNGDDEDYIKFWVEKSGIENSLTEALEKLKENAE